MDLEEIYYYRIQRPEGYAVQKVYTADGRIDVRAAFADLAITVEIINPHPIELGEQPLAHDYIGHIRQPRMVADEANDAAAGALGDPPLGDPEEPHIEIIEVEFADTPIALPTLPCKVRPP